MSCLIWIIQRLAVDFPIPNSCAISSTVSPDLRSTRQSNILRRIAGDSTLGRRPTLRCRSANTSSSIGHPFMTRDARKLDQWDEGT